MPRSLLIFAAFCLCGFAQDTKKSDALQKLHDEALADAIKKESWDPKKVSVTLIDLKNKTRASSNLQLLRNGKSEGPFTN